jgi:hypothetical protein
MGWTTNGSKYRNLLKVIVGCSALLIWRAGKIARPSGSGSSAAWKNSWELR